MLNKKNFLLILVVFSLIILSFFYARVIKTSQEKEYRRGEIFYSNGKDYVVVSNNQFIEILEITPNDRLLQVSQVHNMKNINDLCVSHESQGTFLIVLTGNNLIKYDITNPVFPRISQKRNLYKNIRRGQYKNGYMHVMACNDDYIFAAGKLGVRRFSKENLASEVPYTFERGYGLAVDNNKLAVIEKDRGLIYDIDTAELEKEYKLENKDSVYRRPNIDAVGNVYFISDKSMIKASYDKLLSGQYFGNNESGDNYSYAVSVLPNRGIFYVNGRSIVKFDKNFNETNNIKAASPQVYGPNSWAVDISAKGVKNGQRVVVFNKSSVLLFDGDLNFLFQYKYSPLAIYEQGISTELKIVPSRYIGASGSGTVDLRLFGFWPNEKVEVSFAKDKYNVQVNSLGYGWLQMQVPDLGEPGRVYIKALGLDSSLRYQSSFDIK